MRRLAVILIFLLVAGALVYWALPGGPRELDRVAHPAGYSIVKPAGWGANMVTKADGNYRDEIALAPENWKGLPPLIWVRRYANPPSTSDLQQKGYIRGNLSGSEAWVHQERPKKYTMRLAILEHAGDWYEIGVSVPGKESARLDDWWQFAQTFRPSPINSNPPTSHPVTE